MLKKGEKKYTLHSKHENAGMAMLHQIFKARSVTRNNESHFTMIKIAVHQENTRIINRYTLIASFLNIRKKNW